MAVASSRGRSTDHLHLQLSQKIWTKNSPTSHHTSTNHHHQQTDASIAHDPRVMAVPVVYYLSRNGLLDHPHFILVPLSSSNGLFLRDVINRLNILRGKGMPSQYSWSSKRGYKNGYVWQDLEENDFIHPVHGGEYVLKGSQILELPSPSSSHSKSPETSSSSDTKIIPAFPAPANQSWGTIDLHEYQVYKTESIPEFSGKAAADASTQTDDKRRRRSRASLKESDGIVEEEREKVEELSRDEVSPPPSDSSPETLESLMKAGGRIVLAPSSSSQTINQADQSSLSETADRTVGDCPSGRMKASSVLMSLLSCGSISFRDCGVTAIKDHGFSLVSHQKMKLPRGENQTGLSEKEGESMMMMNDAMTEVENNASRSFAKMALEDREYFSGSLIETKKDEFSALKRSSSYNADRSSRIKLAEKEEDGVKAKCIPRRAKDTNRCK